MNSPASQGSVRSRIVARRTYNRPREDGTFETWLDTIDRVTEHQRWLWERAQEGSLTLDQNEELTNLRTLMLSRKSLPAGRTLWLGGTDLVKRREASMFNPLSRDTRFVTTQGVKTFADFADGDTVTVLTHAGNWKPARVFDAGVRQMVKLGLRRGHSRTVINSSTDHTWILTGGVRTIATELEIGDKLCLMPDLRFYDWDFDTSQPDEQFWWCYGFVYGDGAVAKSGGSVTSRVRLCGEKAKHLPRFQACGFGFSYPPSCGEDPFVYTGKYLKTLPDDTADPRLIRAFLHGYLSADAGKTTGHAGVRFVSLSVSDAEAAAFVRRWVPVFGLYVLRDEYEEQETNYGTRRATFFSFTTGGALPWSVETIDTIADENCWCLTVDDDHSFVLPNGVVSGNCSHAAVRTVHDAVDVFWLLLQGCGTGFTPAPGSLCGFTRKMEVSVTRSTRVEAGGSQANAESYDPKDRVWTIKVGDSAEAWARAVGKVLAGKFPARKLVFDLSEIRPAGQRLKGYGWICSGDQNLSTALAAIAGIMNRRAGKLLTKLDILDVVNWLGTVLSSRRSAQIALVEYGSDEWRAFSEAKTGEWWKDNPQRSQSNNTLVCYEHPGRRGILNTLETMHATGGGDPALLNGAEAKRRAPWFSGVNPCAEILLSDKGFCNLCTTDLGKFRDDHTGLLDAIRLITRANYRQTVVNLRDGVLQDSWHQQNEYLRLCGVSLTGYATRPDLTAYDFKQIRQAAVAAAFSMADELGLERPKNVTTGKPEGTLAKVMDSPEGCHRPPGRFVFNNVAFSRHDTAVPALSAAGYRVFDHPLDPTSQIVTLPVEWSGVPFGPDGANHETAVEQLDRYRAIMRSYCDQNQSVTISYDESELPGVADWLDRHWDDVVGVSFLRRNDPTKTAADLGYPYLPQEVVTEATYREYVARLKEVDIDGSDAVVDTGSECAGGVCPIK